MELFAEKAGTQNVTICKRLQGSDTILTLPIHQRYQDATPDGGYVDVTLPKAQLLVGCKSRLKEHRVSKIDLCSPCVDLVPKWRTVSYETVRFLYIPNLR